MLNNIKDITLSGQQSDALSKILHWFLHGEEQYFVLAGYAGSGKSTIANLLTQEVVCQFVAYTGKAVNVLRDKGATNAKTIHGYLYDCLGNDDNGEPVFDVKQQNLFGRYLLVVDEYSMLDDDSISDILSKCGKVIFIGDPMQLPSIKKGKNKLKPDFFLTEIHRQALDSPIIKWAHEIRNGNIPKIGLKDGNFQVVSKKEANRHIFDSVEQVICGRNDTKRRIDIAMREHYGFSEQSDFPIKGDKMICSKNNHTQGLYNGLLFSCEKTVKDKNHTAYRLYCNGMESLSWSGDILGYNPKEYDYKSRLERFHYAYGITCHKTQGSEFDSVFIYDESWGVEKLNWLYTAVTRAKNDCILAL